MKAVLRSLVYLVLFLALVLGGCSSSENKPDLEFYMYGDYSNITGLNPDFEIDDELTDEEVYFDGLIKCESDPPEVSIQLFNLSIYSEEENYMIDGMEVEEFVDEEWVWFPEFDSEFVNLTKLGVVLALDVSGSLAEDFNDVLTFAIEFVEIIHENSPEAQIGIVAFSNTTTSIAPSNDIAMVEAFINSLQQGQYSCMYQAIDESIDLLMDLEVDGRALVTFTDGRDNYSNPAITPELLVSRLETNGIRSYTMGLDGNGGVNDAVLSDLAVNGDYRPASSKNDLKQIFNYFADSVSNVYQIDYRRNSQEIDHRQIRFKFIDER